MRTERIFQVHGIQGHDLGLWRGTDEVDVLNGVAREMGYKDFDELFDSESQLGMSISIQAMSEDGNDDAVSIER